MTAEFLFLVSYSATLLLPGYIVQRILKLDLNWFLSSLSISYTLFALFFVVANYFSIPANLFLTAYSVLVFLCVGCCIFRLIIDKPSFNNDLKPILTILLCSVLYQFAFGSFSEVPADIYAHIERYQIVLANINNNSLGVSLEWTQLFFQRSGVFYYLIAAVASITVTPTESIITIVDFANRTLFITTVYFFTKAIFRESSNTKVIATAACIFVFLHMGINVFAYVRYYSIAPTILNMVIYFAAVSLFIETIKSDFNFKTGIAYLLIFLFMAAASTIHVQEAMYIGLVIGLVSLLGVLSKFSVTHLEARTNTAQVVTLTILCITTFIVFYIYSHLNLPREPNLQWRLWEFGAGYGLIPDITTLNLKYQFSRVMTLWGLLVYGLFFLNIKRFKSNLFIMAGMLSPLVTILNPFFVDLFLRHYNSSALWRVCFIIPIHFVAADLFIYYLNKCIQGTLITKMSSGIVLTAFVLLLLPIKNTWQGVHYSRFPTLAQSDPLLSHVHYKDLISKLDSLEKPYQILTDPMTGYMVSAMTKHKNIRNKFLRGNYFKHFTFDSYEDRPLDKYKGYLIVTNQRDKVASRIGKLSNHWLKDEWQQKHHYYTPSLLTHITSNPKQFSVLWENDGVAVYKIN